MRLAGLRCGDDGRSCLRADQRAGKLLVTYKIIDVNRRISCRVS